MYDKILHTNFRLNSRLAFPRTLRTLCFLRPGKQKRRRRSFSDRSAFAVHVADYRRMPSLCQVVSRLIFYFLQTFAGITILTCSPAPFLFNSQKLFAFPACSPPACAPVPPRGRVLPFGGFPSKPWFFRLIFGLNYSKLILVRHIRHELREMAQFRVFFFDVFHALFCLIFHTISVYIIHTRNAIRRRTSER